MPRKASLTLNQKIERAEAEAARLKAKYDAAVAELAQLRELQDEGKQKELLSALSRTRRSYADIMEFILSDPSTEEAAG